jgi:hypothetical protein
MTAKKRAEPTPGHSPEPWTTDPRAGHEAIVDADGLRVADFHIFGRSTANNHANVRRVIETAAERDRLKTANAELAEALKDTIARFERCMIFRGIGSEYTVLATENARATLTAFGPVEEPAL